MRTARGSSVLAIRRYDGIKHARSARSRRRADRGGSFWINLLNETGRLCKVFRPEGEWPLK